MDSVAERTVRLGFWTVLLLSAFAWAPVAYPGYWEALEGFVPVFNVTQSGAIASVATVPDLWRGTGRATFLLAQPLLLLGFTPVASVRITFAISIILGGLGIYIWLHTRLGDRGAGMAGMLYMLWPPLLATVYIRGSLSDALVLGLFPLALAGAAIYAESRSPSAAGILVLSILWMWRTQAGMAAFATLILLVYALFVERSRMGVLIVAMSGAAGLASLIPLWDVQSPAEVDFSEHFVYPNQLFYGDWSVAPSIAGWQDQYPFQLGFSVLVFGILAFWFWRTDASRWQDSDLSRLLGFGFAGSALLVMLVLPVSSLLWAVSYAERLLTYPWQLLLLAGPMMAAVAGSLPVLNESLRRPVLWATLIILIIIGSYSYLTTEYTLTDPPVMPIAILGEDHNIVLLETHLTEDKETGEILLELTWQVLRPPEFDYNVFFQALRADGDTYQVLAQFDGQPLNGERPATGWQAGEIFQDTYTLDLSDAPESSSLGDAKLRYYWGYYDWRDGTRLPVDGGIDDKLVFYGK